MSLTKKVTELIIGITIGTVLACTVMIIICASIYIFHYAMTGEPIVELINVE